MQELAKQWMASPHFGGWRVGMASLDSNPIGQSIRSAICYSAPPYLEWGGYIEGRGPSSLLPDLTHPGTVAFLLEDVRRAWGGRWAYIDTFQLAGDEYCVRAMTVSHGFKSPPSESLAAALILTLFAAPGADRE